MVNQQSVDGQLRELALFAGAGGGILGGKLLGWRTVCAVERNPYAASVLVARQNDGVLDSFPVWDDVCTFDGRPWHGTVDVVSGGFPCTDISAAGKGAGIDGEHSGLWREMARIIREVRPKYVFVENSPMLTSRGLGRVLGDLAELGFDAEWGVLGAHHANLPHHRERIWVLATHPDLQHVERRSSYPFQRFPGIQGVIYPGVAKNEQGLRSILAPGLCRNFNGVDAQVDRLTAIGNGQVPAVAALAWRILTQG